MNPKLVRAYRKLVPLLMAGALLQSPSCSLDTAALASGLVTSVANSFITNLVFGLFNVGTGF